MSLLKKLFGGGGAEKNLTAREGFVIASEALKAKYPEAENAYLCCMYTSVFDSNEIIHPDGTCQAWHFDFFSPTSRVLHLIRVQKGLARAKKVQWERTGKVPIEYICATYGMQSAERISEPPSLPDDWLDSPALVEATYEALKPYRDPKGDEMAPAALCFPANYLRYLHEEKAREALMFPPAPPDSFAAICTTEELYQEDSYLIYVHAKTGKILGTHVFRFPNLFYFGSSMNW